MTTHSVHEADHFVRAGQRAEEGLDAVAVELGSDDRNHAYHLLRAWLHTVRDRIGVESAAHFAAQLPGPARALIVPGRRRGEA